MNFAELMDSWITEKITRAQTDLIARVSKLEMRVQELEERAVTLDTVRGIVNEVVAAALEEIPSRGSLTEFRVGDLIQTQLCNTDWADLIGEEVNELIESAIDNNDSIRDEIRSLVDEQLDGELDDLRITVRRG